MSHQETVRLSDEEWVAQFDGGDRGDGWVDAWIPCEHGDFLRNQVQAVLAFKRVGGAWQIIVTEDLLEQAPEAIHAVLGVALREMRDLHGYDGSGDDA